MHIAMSRYRADFVPTVLRRCTLLTLLALCGCSGSLGGTIADGGTESPAEPDIDATSGTESPPPGSPPDRDRDRSAENDEVAAGDTEEMEAGPGAPEPAPNTSSDTDGDDPAAAPAPPDTVDEPAVQARASAGCGTSAQGTNQFERHTIDVNGEMREYYLRIPKSYDPTRSYPLVFRFHGSGGDGSSGGLDIEQASRDEALIASPSGRNGRWSFQRDGADVALFDTLLAHLSETLCIDQQRVFTYGFSAGGTFANLLACARSEQVRGVTAVSAGTRANNCGAPVAAMIIHGKQDDVVVLAEGEAARDQYLELNGCSRESAPGEPPPCVAYADCKPEAPVLFCPTESRHNPQGAFSGPAAWTFFSGLGIRSN